MAAVIAGGDPVWLSVGVNANAWMSKQLGADGVITEYAFAHYGNHAINLIGYQPHRRSGRQVPHPQHLGPARGQRGLRLDQRLDDPELHALRLQAVHVSEARRR